MVTLSLTKIIHFLKKPENRWFEVLAIIAFLFTLWKLYYNKETEGFHTELNESYSLKQGSDEIYDDFYADLYDYIVTPELCAQEVDAIVQNTQTSVETSIVLDIGSRNGQTLMEFRRRGYNNVYGIEKHKAMVSHSHEDLMDHVLCAETTDKMNFERGTFSHVLCLHQSLYDQPDVSIFFQNCRYWLKPGGVLVLHLVQYQKKNPEVAIRIPEKNIKYIRTVEIIEKSVIIKETFTDIQTHHVRQQESRPHYQELDRIINAAVFYGFNLQGKTRISSQVVPPGCTEYLYFLTIS